MVITIYKTNRSGKVLFDITSGDREVRDFFHKRYGVVGECDPRDLIKTMDDISDWANNVHGEECLFDVE